MFAIYNVNGLEFRDTLDRLYRVKPLQKTQELQNSLSDFEEGLERHYKPPKEEKEDPQLQKAKKAYKKVANLSDEQEIFHVQQVMSQNLITIPLDADIQYAWNIMDSYTITQIPVLNYHNKIVGQITLKDITRLLIEDPKYIQSSLSKAVHNIMNEFVITTDPITDIRRAAKVMIDYGINAIPVVDAHDILRGIITKKDLVKAISTEPHFQMWY